MKIPIKGIVVFGLVCTVAVESAILIPRIRLGIDESQMPEESLRPAGASYLQVSSTDGLPGVSTALQPAQKTFQRESTRDVATYIAETGATEEARLELARQKAEAKASFLEEQQRLALEYQELQKELAEQRAQQNLNDPNVPGYVPGVGTYLVGEGGTLNNPGGLTVIPPGGTASVDKNLHPSGDNGDYNYIPNVPGSSLNGNTGNNGSMIDPNGQGTSPGNTTIDSGTTFNPASSTPSSPASDGGSNTYCGEFACTFVCTCANCFNPTAWPEGRLASTFMLVPTPYITPGIMCRVEGGLGGWYDTEDGDKVLTGRNIIVFHADHSVGAGETSAYVKVYTG